MSDSILRHSFIHKVNVPFCSFACSVALMNNTESEVQNNDVIILELANVFFFD